MRKANDNKEEGWFKHFDAYFFCDLTKPKNLKLKKAFNTIFGKIIKVPI